MQKTYHEIAPAKINLSLKVIGKDPISSYHLLEMVNARISLIDKIKLSVLPSSSEDQLIVTGKYVTDSIGQTLQEISTNIAHKAVELFRIEYKVFDPVLLCIDKQIPVGAGLGGGSSDAAAVLKILAKHCLHLTHSLSQYTGSMNIALKLGADVPYFLSDDPWQKVSGFGELLQSISSAHPARQLKDQIITLMLPPYGVSTAAAFAQYRNINCNFSEKCESDIKWKIGENDLLGASFATEIRLESLFKKLAKTIGLDRIFMSGSGSSSYSVNLSREEIELCRQILVKENGIILQLRFL